MRILLVASDVPATSSMPGSPRVFSFFQHVAPRHEVHLATFASSIGRYETFLAHQEALEVFRSITLLPYPQTMSFWGRQRHRLAQAPYFLTRYRFPEEFRIIRCRLFDLITKLKPDVLFADLLPAAQYVMEFNGLTRVVDAHDAVSLNFRRAAARANSRLQKLRLLLESCSIRRFEVATARTVDAYLVNSHIDQETLESYHPNVKAWYIPNGVDTEYFKPEHTVSDGKTVVFTGVMSYAPNRDAAHFFCSEILPRIKNIVPDVKVQLVGSNPPQDVRALARDGVAVTGTVPDVRHFVHRADVYVSPLRFGTGVKNKILSALAMEKAVVATPESCAGLDVTAGEHLLVGHNPDDFAAHVVELLTNPDRRRHLGIAARSLVVGRYRWDASARQLEALLEDLTFRSRERAIEWM